MIEQALATAGCRPVAWRDWIARQEPDPIAAAARTALAGAQTERTAAVLLDQYHGALRQALEETELLLRMGDQAAARRSIETLLARAILGRHLVRPWQVVLAGPVNVGKSSLINALVGYPRAIVHPAAGTTRDVVPVQTAIAGWPVELCDTAGLRSATHPVEQAGVARAEEGLAAADLVVLVFDRSAAWSAADQALVDAWPQTLVVYNKCDLPPAGGLRPEGLCTSALRGDGLHALPHAIAARLVPDPPPAGAAVPFTEEQVERLRAIGSRVQGSGFRVQG
jgi:tRNA modification GTPase